MYEIKKKKSTNVLIPFVVQQTNLIVNKILKYLY